MRDEQRKIMRDLKEERVWEFLLVLLLVITGFIFGMSRGEDNGLEKVRREAITKGHAKYNCNPLTGERKFEWK